MEAYFVAYLDRLTSLHGEVEQTVEGLSEAALDWTPGPNMSSLAVLAIHLSGSEQFRIGDLIGRGTTQRNREAEFRTQGLDAATIKQRLADVLDDSRTTIARLTYEDLNKLRVDPAGDSYTVAWLLTQTMMHVALHVGHMQMMRQLWDQRSPTT